MSDPIVIETGRRRTATSRRRPAITTPKQNAASATLGLPGSAGRSIDWLSDARATILGLALVAPILIAMMVGSAAATILASGIALVASLMSPMTGLIALAFMAPIQRPLVIPTPGLYVAIIATILLGVVLRLPIERPRVRGPSREVLLLGAFLVYASAQFLGGRLDSFSPRGTEIASLFADITTAVLAFIVASIVLRGRSPYPILTALLLSGLFASAMALAQSQGAEGLFGQLLGPSGSADRMTGPFGDPNYFGAYLAVLATLSFACSAITNSPWLKITTLALAGFVSAALLLTLSRGGIVALAAGLITIAFSRGRRAGLMALGALVLVVVIAYPMFADLRFGGGDSSPSSRAVVTDSSGRLDAWLAGQDVFLSAPLFGVGFGRFAEESSIGIAAHNWYINVLAEAGIVGFVLWSLFIIAVLYSLRRVPSSARTVGYSVLAAWMVGSIFLELPMAYQVSGPVLIVLAAALWADWAPRGPETVAATDQRPPHGAPRLPVRPYRPQLGLPSSRSDTHDVDRRLARADDSSRTPVDEPIDRTSMG